MHRMYKNVKNNVNHWAWKIHQLNIVQWRVVRFVPVTTYSRVWQAPYGRDSRCSEQPDKRIAALSPDSWQVVHEKSSLFCNYTICLRKS